MSPATEPARRRVRVRWWGVAIVVVACLVVAEAGARVIGPNIDRESGSEERVFVKADQIYDRDGPTDLVVMGSSESAAGLIPSIILDEAKSLDGGYNAALVGETPELTNEWANRVVLPQLDPEVVVVSMLPTGVLDYSGTELDPSPGTAEAYAAALDQIDPGGLGSLGWELRQRSALIRYRPYLRDPIALWDGIRTTLAGGAEDVEPEGLTIDARTETDPRKVEALTAPDGEILEYREPSTPGLGNAAAVAAFSAATQVPVDYEPLGKLFDDIEASGATPVLALAPLDRGVLEAEGADLTGLDDLAAEITDWAEGRGVPVFSEFDQSWPADWFNDRQHLSQRGAEQWSRELGDWLEGLCTAGELPDACG